jgi:DNA-binding SARP family transcriptional activator
MASDVAQFRILGPLAVVRGDGEHVSLGGVRQRCFLALLLLNANRVQSVDALIDAIWGERPPATALTMLHQFASRLRPVVEPVGALVTRKPGYVLELPRDALDANRFTAFIERGKALIAAGELKEGERELEAGLGLWTGRALEDLRFESAITVYADFLEEQRISALEERFDVELELGRHVEIIGELQGLLAEHPERERLAGQLMVALYRAGRQTEALSLYDAVRKYLAVELGLSPGPQVEKLHTAILAHDPSLGAPAVPRWRIGGRRISKVAAGIAALAAVTLVAAAVSLGVVFATRGGEGPRPVVPDDERLPFPDVPNRLFGSYNAVIPPGQSEQTMTLRGPDDSVCKPLLGGKGTCFLIHPATNEIDPGARGQAAFHDGMVVLRYVRIPFLPRCQREIDRYRVSENQRRLILVKRVVVMGPFDECSFSAFIRTAEK